MKNLKTTLAKVITSKPDVIQFAKDRKYEEAWILNLADSKPSVSQIEQYLTKEKFEVIIVEYIWNSKNDDNRFVLTLFLDQHCQLKNPKEFVNLSLDLFYHYSDFSSFIDRVDNTIIGSECLLLYPVDSVNMSVFNYWLSVGPVELWQKGETYQYAEMISKIALRPDVQTTNLNYQGLLFRFNPDKTVARPYYGIKTPCCSKVGNNWVIDFKKVDYWMKLMLGK